MEYLKEQQAGSMKLKNPGKIQAMTPKRRNLEAEKKEAYKRIDASRPPVCEGCDNNWMEHSHCFPQAYKNYLYVADERFIRRYCRQCHLNWENSYIWRLRDGRRTMEALKIEDFEFFMRKLVKASDRLGEYREKNWLQIENKTIKIPDWIGKMLIDNF